MREGKVCLIGTEHGEKEVVGNNTDENGKGAKNLKDDLPFVLKHSVAQKYSLITNYQNHYQNIYLCYK